MKKLYLRGEISVNCYIIDYNDKCYIIDPSYEKKKIVEYVDNNNLKVEGILLTHGHLDHIGAVDCFDVPIFIYEKEYDLLMNDDLNGYNSLGVNNPLELSKFNIQKFSLNKEFNIDDKKIFVIHTPSHTSGGVCYVFDKMIFTGDTIFKGAVGRWDFPTGNIEELKKSVVKIIDTFDNDYEIYPGHNDSSKIGIEKHENKYYNMWKN
ncbi:MAG: MBL fold metallo-hydrolase [Bacilli bacterium]